MGHCGWPRRGLALPCRSPAPTQIQEPRHPESPGRSWRRHQARASSAATTAPGGPWLAKCPTQATTISEAPLFPPGSAPGLDPPGHPSRHPTSPGPALGSLLHHFPALRAGLPSATCRSSWVKWGDRPCKSGGGSIPSMLSWSHILCPPWPRAADAEPAWAGTEGESQSGPGPDLLCAV